MCGLSDGMRLGARWLTVADGIKWSGDLSGNLKGLNRRNQAAMVATAKLFAPRIQAHMRNNASWTDQTGNARNGLFTSVQVSKNQTAIVLYHSVPYGVWLEVRWDGKYAIINPSIQYWAPKYFAMLAKSMFKESASAS